MTEIDESTNGEKIQDLKGLLKSAMQDMPHPANSCGVYLLVEDKDNESEIVYIGQSKNCLSRVLQHTNDKMFTRWLYIRQDESEIESLEAIFIAAIRPKYNKVIPAKSGYHRESSVVSKLSKVGLSPVEIGDALRPIKPIEFRGARYYQISQIKHGNMPSAGALH